MGKKNRLLLKKGAEASLFLEYCCNHKAVYKKRISKKYRVIELDRELQMKRTKRESQIIQKAKNGGIPTPTIFMVDLDKATIIMEFIEGKELKQVIEKKSRKERRNLCRNIGKYVGILHTLGIIHGDLTTSNIILTPNNRIVFIDFGLSEITKEFEAKGVDLHLMKNSLKNTHYHFADECFKNIIFGYQNVIGKEETFKVLRKISNIEKRGRYISKR
jgi:Kae1-associated kinase Bud32